MTTPKETSEFYQVCQSIITKYESGEISYDAAHTQIVEASEMYEGGEALYFAELDLFCARDLMMEC